MCMYIHVYIGMYVCIYIYRYVCMYAWYVYYRLRTWVEIEVLPCDFG